MLFNSFEFIFLFLPLTFGLYFFLAKRSHEAAIRALVAASLFFYGWWNPVYLVLITTSMIGNFGLGEWIAKARNRDATRAKWLMFLGIAVNLSTLAYFKYANFLVGTFCALFGSSFDVGIIILPLAISFFTFQQIAYLVDSFKGITEEYSFSHYALFVTFFPQLIAGPIVHHRDMLPQFMRHKALLPKMDNISVGLAIFTIGLFKKTVLADSAAQYSSPVFAAAEAGMTLTFFDAWGGALSYTMQLYFDFSGYSDMAIGAARIFGIKLPLNFYSPYKATNISEFWRRWHMTLSRFLRDYIYIPMGGNRKGLFRRHANLIVTMLLGGLWHGAGWTFVVWGGLHGLYLVLHNSWSATRKRILPHHGPPGVLGRTLGWTMTFISVVVGWVFFRAESFDGALNVLTGMSGKSGVALPNALAAQLGSSWRFLSNLGWTTYLGGGRDFVFTWLWLGVLVPIALIMPNTQQLMARFDPALNEHKSNSGSQIQPLSRVIEKISWKPSTAWAVASGFTLAIGIMAMSRISEFLYFQF